MSIKETRARLWFDSEEDRKFYDDLMMANIEPTQQEDIEKPNFSLVNNRSKREYFFSYNKKATDAFDRLLDPIHESMRSNKEASLRYFRQMPFVTSVLSTGLVYLVLRELPIRNFYARGFIMFGFLNYLLRKFRLEPHRFALHFTTPYRYEFETLFVNKQNLRAV